MSEYATDGAKIVFKPQGPWDWLGWDGRVTLDVSTSKLRVKGKGVALPADVIRAAVKVIARAYKAHAFPDIPGAVTLCQVVIDTSTLSERTRVGHQRAVLKSTKGTFTVTCVPSIKAGVPPVPDPILVKQGRWCIEDVKQNIARSK